MLSRTIVIAALVFGYSSGAATAADAGSAPVFSLTIEVEPVTGAPPETRAISLDEAALRQARRLDVQDAREHIVRGVSLRELVLLAHAPKSVNAAIFLFSDGMQIPVHLRDSAEVDAVFIAFEHGDARERFTRTYPLAGKPELPCPKVVYSRAATAYSHWLYPTQLASVKLVSWKAHQARLAQPTRSVPNRGGWRLYERHCQACHGIGGQGATRGADFLSDMEAYRRIPPLADTDWSQQPSLHEKVKGFTDGTMPVLKHIPDAEIATLWRWLHAIHRGATR